MDRANRNAKSTSKTCFRIIFDLFVIEDPCIKNASNHTFTTMDASLGIRSRYIFRADH